jgi:hypothetical protein
MSRNQWRKRGQAGVLIVIGPGLRWKITGFER